MRDFFYAQICVFDTCLTFYLNLAIGYPAVNYVTGTNGLGNFTSRKNNPYFFGYRMLYPLPVVRGDRYPLVTRDKYLYKKQGCKLSRTEPNTPLLKFSS